VGIKFEGEPPFDLGVAQTVSAQVLEATVVLRVTVVVPEIRSKPVPGGTCKGTKRGWLFLIDFAFSA